MALRGPATPDGARRFEPDTTLEHLPPPRLCAAPPPHAILRGGGRDSHTLPHSLSLLGEAVVRAAVVEHQLRQARARAAPVRGWCGLPLPLSHDRKRVGDRRRCWRRADLFFQPPRHHRERICRTCHSGSLRRPGRCAQLGWPRWVPPRFGAPEATLLGPGTMPSCEACCEPG